MSVSANSLTNQEYDERKKVLEELKKLAKAEQEHIFFILKKHKVEYSENSNGVFFDLSRVGTEPFEEIQKFLIFCQANRSEFEARLQEMETSRMNLGEQTFG